MFSSDESGRYFGGHCNFVLDFVQRIEAKGVDFIVTPLGSAGTQYTFENLFQVLKPKK